MGWEGGRRKDGDFQFLPPRRPHVRTSTHTLRWICPLTHSLGSGLPLHSLSLSLRSFSPSPSLSLPSSPLVRTLFAESLPPPPPPPPIPILPPFRCALSSSMMRSLPLFLSPTHSPPLVGTCPDSSPRNINLLFEINAMSHPRETYAIAISFLVHPLEELGEYHLLCIAAWSL